MVTRQQHRLHGSRPQGGLRSTLGVRTSAGLAPWRLCGGLLRPPLAATRWLSCGWLTFWIAGWLVWGVAGGSLHAQTEAEEPVKPASDGEQLPDILSDGTLDSKARLFLSDKDGNLVLVPDESYQDYFLNSGSKTVAGAAGLPAAALEKVDVHIDVVDDTAKVRGEFAVMLTQEIATSVGLRFGTVQLSEWSFSGERDKNLIQPSRDESGWSWILLGQPGLMQTASLKGISRVSREADRRNLRVSLPSAACTIHLQLPPNAVDVRVRNEDVMEPQETTGKGVGLTVRSNGGMFSVSWRDQATLMQVAAVEANSNTEFVINDPNQPWIASTKLKVRWYGQDASNQIRIQLPPGAQWRALPNSEFERYRITSVDASLPPPASSARGTGVDQGANATAAVDRSLPAEGVPTPPAPAEAPNDAAADVTPEPPVTEPPLAEAAAASPPAAEQSAAEQPAAAPPAEPAEDAEPAAPLPVQLVLENYDVTRNETVEVLLEWEWLPPDAAEENLATEVKLPVPLLHGVDQHQGKIDCIIPSKYAIVFREGEGAEMSYQGPLMDAFARQQLQFEFDRQDFDLGLVFRREQGLPTVRPTYQVQVDENKLVMTMWFDCSFDTNQPQMEIGLILDEWLIQENTARVVSDPTDPFSSEGDVLRVRQQVDRNYVISRAGVEPSNYGASRHVDQVWRVVAERSWSAEDKVLYFQVPQIIRGQVNGNPEIDHGSGALLVTSASNVLLQWQESAGTGLQRDSFSTEYQRFVRNASVRKPLAYRFQSNGETPVWAGKAELLPQQVSVEQHVDLEVVASQLTIRQNFDLQVANKPLSELRFAVRSDAAERPPQVYVNQNLVSSSLVGTLSERELDELLAANQTTATVGTAASPEATNGNGSAGTVSNGANGQTWQIYQLVGSPELLGSTRITVRSSIVWKSNAAANSEAGAESVSTVGVPVATLLLPGGTRQLQQDWTLRTDSLAELVSSAEDAHFQDGLGSGQKLRTLTEGQHEIQLNLRPRQTLGVAPVRMGSSWLQTFVTGRQRRDRFVARLETEANELVLKLPAPANIRQQKVRVSVDGVEQPYDYDVPTDTLTISLTGTGRSEHVLEVSYFLPDALAWVTQLHVSPPLVLGAEQSDRFYWQLLTPSVQHLGWSPNELTAEWTWKWSGLWWERQSELNQRELETRLTTDYQESPPTSANSYVMSGRGVEDTFSVWVLSRFILWFPVGVVVIAISFAALNFAFVRRPAFVFALAAGVAGLAMVWPDMAVLAGQTAVLSLGLVALVWVIQGAVDSRVRRRSVFTTRPSTYVDRSDHYSASRGARSAQPTVTHAGSSVGANGG